MYSQTITDMLETYHYEMAILSTANHLLSTDTFKSMRAYVRRRCKGVRVSLPSDVNAASVEALEVMPSGSVVVQVLNNSCYDSSYHIVRLMPRLRAVSSFAACHFHQLVVILESTRLHPFDCPEHTESLRSRCEAATCSLQQVL